MFHVALYQPEIPPNTGNIIRLCANSGSTLHLIGAPGFTLDDSKLRRAGLDYREWTLIKSHPDLETFLRLTQPARLLACSTRGQRHYHDENFIANDCLLFGPETRGLPDAILDDPAVHSILRIPMRAHSRSMNLSNAVAVVLFEAWRQLGFSSGV